MQWLLDAISALFSLIPELIWDAICWVWNTVFGPVLKWIFVDFIWGTVIAYIRTLLRFKAIFFGIIACAYSYLKEWWQSVLDFCIDCACTVLETCITAFDITMPDNVAEGIFTLFKFYDLIDSFVPLTEAIGMIAIYLMLWCLMMLFKIAIKLWQAVPGT